METNSEGSMTHYTQGYKDQVYDVKPERKNSMPSVEQLAKILGTELDNLQTQLTQTRAAYDAMWIEMTKPKLITTSSELVDALKNPGNYQLFPGTYVGNFQALADGVTIMGTDQSPRLFPGITGQYTLLPFDKSKPTLSITGSSF